MVAAVMGALRIFHDAGWSAWAALAVTLFPGLTVLAAVALWGHRFRGQYIAAGVAAMPLVVGVLGYLLAVRQLDAVLSPASGLSFPVERLAELRERGRHEAFQSVVVGAALSGLLLLLAVGAAA